ncbi:MAG: hypothetical protein JWM74_681 [Myxococcaceae bacterium]|nr:hypothetical protein [Myxococcaceae bacterium]
MALRLRGIVRGERKGEVQLLRASLELPPAPPTRGDVSHDFDLELDDGARVAIDASSGLTVVPERTQRATWGALENEIAAAPFRESAPGPHLTVTLKSAAATDGDVVEVYGEATEHSFEDAGATTRDAPKQRVSRLRAIIVGVGPDARAALDAAIGLRAKAEATAAARTADALRDASQRSEAPRPRGHLAWFAAAGVVIAVAVAIPLSPLTVDLLACAMGLVASALYFWWRTRAPNLYEGDVRILKSMLDGGGILVPLVAAGMATLPAIVADFPPNHLAYRSRAISDSGWITNWSEASVVCWAAYIACLGVAVHLASRRSARILSTLLAAPAHPEPPFAKTWGSTMGTVADPTPVELDGEALAVAAIAEEEVQTSGSYFDFTADRILREGSFFVEGAAGTFEVHPARAIWGSAVQRIPSKTPPDERQMQAVRADVIPIGGRVLVAGRASRANGERHGSIDATGPESLVFYAGPAGSDPRAFVSSALRRRSTTIAVLALMTFGLAAGGTVVATTVAPPNFESRR